MNISEWATCQNHMDVLGRSLPSTRHLTLTTAAPAIEMPLHQNRGAAVVVKMPEISLPSHYVQSLTVGVVKAVSGKTIIAPILRWL